MDNIWDYVKVLIAPILGFLGWSYKRHREEIRMLQTQLEEQREELGVIKIENAVVKSQLEDIKVRLNELKDLITCLLDKYNSRRK